jgi:hypothetical protein
LGIRKGKFRWIGHTLRKDDGGCLTMEPSSKQEEKKTKKIVGEARLSKKRGEVGNN